MVVSKTIKEQIEKFPTDFVFGLSDFKMDPSMNQAVVRTLQRMAEKGELRKISKGKYYKPRLSIFGELKPSPSQIVKDLLFDGDKTIGYLTCSSIYSSLGLTTQISSKIEIGSNRYRQPFERNGYNIAIVLQRNEITKENIPALRVLDCIRFFKEIPAAIPDEACARIIEIVRGFDDEYRQILTDCALAYQPYVRAITGAVLEKLGGDTNNVRSLFESLSGISRYYLPISNETLTNKLKWRIYESARK
ncbi:MAG: DUF6088 family protein [Clostridium sp.]|nr:DUF6088 family protein [Clostridium sp.]